MSNISISNIYMICFNLKLRRINESRQLQVDIRSIVEMKNNNAILQRISHEQEKGQGQTKIKITQKNLHTLKSRKCEIQKKKKEEGGEEKRETK
jgi:hypothetical protein